MLASKGAMRAASMMATDRIAATTVKGERKNR